MSKKEEISHFLKHLLLGFLDVEEDAITETTTIAELGMESLDFVELQVEFEKKYKVKVRPSVFQSGLVKTIGEFVAHVESLLNPEPLAKVG